MSFAPNAKTERLFALLCDAELVGVAGLSPHEQAELAQLQAELQHTDVLRTERIGVERAVAGLALVGNAAQMREPLPPQLTARLEQMAALSFGAGGEVSPLLMPPARSSQAPQPSPQNNVVPFATAAAKRPSRAPIIIAWVAAAACLLLAVGAIYKRPREVVITKTVYLPASQIPQIQAPIASGTPSAPSAMLATNPMNPPVATPAALREALLARGDTTTLPWSKTKDPASQSAAGDVVWNEGLQQGFMRFAGLAKNDPTATQYQLWIFDDTRDARYPVDGGVFDVDGSTGDVIVPISAKVKVGKPSLFAVTVEKPGGVVVSKRERIVLTAATAAAAPTDHKSPQKHG